MASECSRSRRICLFSIAVLGALVIVGAPAGHAQEAPDISRDEFRLVWQRTEAPVANGDTARSWLWGPEPRTGGINERYLDSPDQQREVQYFDKGRMEVNDPSADPTDPWFVTSGLLTRELISGEIQIGDDAFLNTGGGAAIHVAGDHMTPFPQYRHLEVIVDEGSLDLTGSVASQEFTPDGMIEVSDDPPADDGAELVHYVTYLGPDGETVGYNIPRAFWDYLNAPGTVYDDNNTAGTADPLFSWVFVMGLPIADPFWVEVPVGGETRWVLIQPFERRVLTYTPANSPEWQVEMGNIGQHYRDWRSQYFHDAPAGGDTEFYGLHDGGFWRFGTSHGADERWNAMGFTDSFVPGSTLYAREEHKLDGLRVTYWSAGEDGLYLHGWDALDSNRDLQDMVVYSPAVHVLPSEYKEESLRTTTTAISMGHEPERNVIETTVEQEQLVSTPAGLFRTWRVSASGFDNGEIDHRLGERLWFKPELGIVQWLSSDFSAFLLNSNVLEE